MMIGPEPMMRIRWMSVRLGMLHQLYEIVEEVTRIVGTRGGLRMILHAENGVIAEAESFERLVVEIDVRDLALPIVERVRIHGESVIVRRDFHLIGDFVDDGVVRATMSELHLV